MNVNLRRETQKKIISIYESTLPEVQKAKAVAGIFMETPQSLHMEMIEKLVLSFHRCRKITGDGENIKIMCMVSDEDVLWAKNSYYVESFLRNVYVALGRDSLNGVVIAIFSSINGQSSSVACSVAIFEHVLVNLRLCVLSRPKKMKLKHNS